MKTNINVNMNKQIFKKGFRGQDVEKIEGARSKREKKRREEG